MRPPDIPIQGIVKQVTGVTRLSRTGGRGSGMAEMRIFTFLVYSITDRPTNGHNDRWVNGLADERKKSLAESS